MLTFSSEQMAQLNAGAEQAFRREMVAHAQGFAPRLSRAIGEAQLEAAVLAAIDRAREIGFTCRGPIRSCVELIFLFGSFHLDDPQYPALRAALLSPGDEMTRAERVHALVMEYRARVSGAGAANLHRALAALLRVAQAPPLIDADDFPAEMLRLHRMIYPEKAAYLGPERLGALVARAEQTAQGYGFDAPRARAGLACLMFSFGHRCDEDPLYPWIGRTLRDERIVSPQARAERLERKAAVWLGHVVAGNEAGAMQGGRA